MNLNQRPFGSIRDEVCDCIRPTSKLTELHIEKLSDCETDFSILPLIDAIISRNVRKLVVIVRSPDMTFTSLRDLFDATKRVGRAVPWKASRCDPTRVMEPMFVRKTV